MTPGPDTVLLVEDGPDLGPLLRDTLEEWNRRVVLARSGGEALEVLGREKVVLMLLDHGLPDMSAGELVARLRGEQRQVPPLVLMTAHPQLRIDRWPELLAVLEKPFELSELAALLDRQLPPR